MAKTKNTPIRISNAFVPISRPGRTSLDAEGRSPSRFWSATSISCWTPVEFLVAWERSSADVGTEVTPRAASTCPSARGTTSQAIKRDQPDKSEIVDRHANALRDAASAECFDPGRIAAASTKPRKTSATTSRSFQMPTLTTAMPRMTSAETATRRAVSARSARERSSGSGLTSCSPLPVPRSRNPDCSHDRFRLRRGQSTPVTREGGIATKLLSVEHGSKRQVVTEFRGNVRGLTAEPLVSRVTIEKGAPEDQPSAITSLFARYGMDVEVMAMQSGGSRGCCRGWSRLRSSGRSPHSLRRSARRSARARETTRTRS